MGKIFLGIETLYCPNCRYPNMIEVHSDLPDRERLRCIRCGYSALVNFVPILDKYGLPHGLSRAEKRDIGCNLKKESNKIKETL